jgi:hypothetical protein
MKVGTLVRLKHSTRVARVIDRESNGQEHYVTRVLEVMGRYCRIENTVPGHGPASMGWIV